MTVHIAQHPEKFKKPAESPTKKRGRRAALAAALLAAAGAAFFAGRASRPLPPPPVPVVQTVTEPCEAGGKRYPQVPLAEPICTDLRDCDARNRELMSQMRTLVEDLLGRARAAIETAEKAIVKYSNLGVNVTAAIDKLDEAKNALLHAETAMQNNDFPVAREKAQEAERLAKEALDLAEQAYREWRRQQGAPKADSASLISACLKDVRLPPGVVMPRNPGVRVKAIVDENLTVQVLEPFYIAEFVQQTDSAGNPVFDRKGEPVYIPTGPRIVPENENRAALMRCIGETLTQMRPADLKPGTFSASVRINGDS